MSYRNYNGGYGRQQYYDQGASGYSGSGDQGYVSTTNRYKYHYTNEQGLQGIVQSGKIYPSRNTERDAVLGQGVYLTDRAPNTGKSRILQNNYGPDPGYHKQDRADYYIKIPADAVPTIKENSSRGVYKNAYSGPLDLRGIEGVKYGRNGLPEQDL